jgi:CDP-glucose 4,6-dehydratase
MRERSQFWQSKRVFLTGHTGFKGGWLSIWLKEMGAEVCGYALPPESKHSLYSEANVRDGMASIFGDIRDVDLLRKEILDFNPDIVFHLAAQPLVRQSYLAPLETFDTNVMGTANLLDSVLKAKNVRCVVNITTDKCYQNNEWYWPYRESDRLGGHDPYSSSKACSELVTAAFYQSFYENDSIGLATARAGNVIGGGDWARDRLVPDVLQAIDANQPAVLRNPESIRPWQHVLEPLSGYLMLAEKLYQKPNEFSEAFNFGPSLDDAKPVSWIVDEINRHFGVESPPEIERSGNPHEANTLKLDISKAASRLGWNPRWPLHTAIEKITQWHGAWKQGASAETLCADQIKEFESMGIDVEQ